MTAVFHHIGTEGAFTNPLKQILDYPGTITFDGAYLSVYQHRHALKGREPILFIQGDTIGDTGVCTSQQIDELADLGFVLGWHGWSHRKLTELPDHLVIKELSTTNNYKLYAYPHGEWDERTANLVKQMGYLKAYSTTQGQEGNDYAIHREYLQL